MAKTKTPRTTSPRSKKNGNPTDLPVTPLVAAAAEAPAPEVRAEVNARPEVTAEVKAPEVKAAVKAAEPKPIEPKPIEPKPIEAKPIEVREARKTLSEVRRVVPINLEEEIRRRAYQLYEERGCTPGHENDDWLVAEREILTRYTTQLHRSASA